MLSLPQPTIFDGSTPTLPEWARELRAYLNFSQFEHVDLLDVDTQEKHSSLLFMPVDIAMHAPRRETHKSYLNGSTSTLCDTCLVSSKGS